MSPLRIAVVGAGAAGMYAVQHLLEQTAFDVEIDLLESLPTPWGLVRTGVAPDHPEKKLITDRLFDFHLRHGKVAFFGNVHVGRDISHEELAASHHAVIYAVGAADDRQLGLPGEQLAGSWSAREFVAWYNGHPACSDLRFDLSGPRAIVIGTGNVALDVARVLTLPPAELARTDIADHALEALRGSGVREVTVLGRRGCRHAAFHNPELEELLHIDGVEVRIEADDLTTDLADLDWEAGRKMATLLRLQARRVKAPRKRIVFKFGHVPLAVTGADRVTGVKVRTSAEDKPGIVPCDLLLRAIGYRGTALDGLPFDARAGVISNVVGRVVGETGPIPGAYVTGWIKRGPRGVIGSNKRCAAETVACLLTDARAGLLGKRDLADMAPLLERRGSPVVSGEGWRRIDLAERRAGLAADRPRIKQTHVEELLATAAATAARPSPRTAKRPSRRP